MFQSAMGFIAGYACRAQCGGMPCAASLKSGHTRPFKLSIVIHSATVEKISSPGVVQDQRPYVVVRIGDKVKETELGDWSKEKEQWCFREVITLEVIPGDEVSLAVYSSTKYDFWLAAVQLTSTKIGEACFPVSSVMPRLNPEDRDADGIVYTTPVIPFDVRDDGDTTARMYLSFETTQAPQNPRGYKLNGGCCETGAMKWNDIFEDAKDPSQTSPDAEGKC
eukprot:TRINITY_DN81700_c0_g1_i1.p1 TRINITY_DN81700_c0_g1~~TRINITY_DN81700_c0_g1_i1.p1  ORF type:complete len:222 (+),score=47.37 TRINITY_DN81700_c0_g1_i1:79-744(+)